MNNGNEIFAEIGQYSSDSVKRLKEPAGDFSVGIIELGADYYWFRCNWFNSI